VPTIHSETILSNPQMSVLDDEDAGSASTWTSGSRKL
jgi:hypothetical protein